LKLFQTNFVVFKCSGHFAFQERYLHKIRNLNALMKSRLCSAVRPSVCIIPVRKCYTEFSVRCYWKSFHKFWGRV